MKSIQTWMILIPSTSSRKQELHFLNTFLEAAENRETTPDFAMKLIGFNSEWGDVIETSRITRFTVKNEDVVFTTQSGSNYHGSLKDFQGFRNRTVRGDMRVVLPD